MRFCACSLQSCGRMFRSSRFANYQFISYCFRLLHCSGKKKHVEGKCSPDSSEVESRRFIPLCTIGVCDIGAYQIFFSVSQIAQENNMRKKQKTKNRREGVPVSSKALQDKLRDVKIIEKLVWLYHWFKLNENCCHPILYFCPFSFFVRSSYVFLSYSLWGFPIFLSIQKHYNFSDNIPCFVSLSNIINSLASLKPNSLFFAFFFKA